MSDRIVYLNGQWLPESEAKISPYDQWCNEGLAVFETTRSFGLDPFQLTSHLQRLYSSAKYCRIPVPVSLNDLDALCHEAQLCNQPAMQPDDEHRLMITVSPGPRHIYRHAVEEKPTICIADFPLRWTVEGIGKYYDEGVHLQSSVVRMPSPLAISASVKHRSRLAFALAAAQHPWSVLYDEQGYVAEGNGFGLLCVSQGKVYCNPEAHALPSVSVHYALHLSRRLYPICDMRFDRSSLVMADEIILCATPFCLLPATLFDGQLVGSGRPGPVYKKLLSLWSESVKVDIKDQIQRWDGTIVADKEPVHVATRLSAN